MRRLHKFLFLNVVEQALIGIEIGNGRSVALKDPTKSTHIIGGSRMGKSNLMGNLILDDIERNDKAVIVLDPHTELAKSVILKCPPEQAHRLYYFDPFEQYRHQIALGLNPFETTHDSEFELKFEAIMRVFEHSWYTTGFRRAPLMQNTLETFARTLMAAYPTYQTTFEHMLLLTLQDRDGIGQAWRDKLSHCVQNNQAVFQNWIEWKDGRRFTTDMESSRQKIKHLMANPILRAILCQPTTASCFRWRELLDNKGVLLVGLHSLDEEAIRLVGSFVLTQLLATVRSMPPDKRQPCHVYADEFYFFDPQSFAMIIDQASKFKLFCTIAHQRLSQLSEDALPAVKNCGNKIIFRVSAEDAQILRREFPDGKEYISPHDLSELKQWEAAVKYIDGRKTSTALIRTVKGNHEESREVAASIWHRSLACGKPITEREPSEDVILNSNDGNSADEPTLEPTTNKPVPPLTKQEGSPPLTDTKGENRATLQL